MTIKGKNISDSAAKAALRLALGITDSIAYKHIRGDAEYVGNDLYSTVAGAVYGIALRETYSAEVTFRSISIKMWCDTAGAGEVRVYKGAPQLGSFNLSALTFIQSLQFSAGEFNKVHTGFQKLLLTNDVTVYAGEQLSVFVIPSAGVFNLKRWTSLYGSAPERVYICYNIVSSLWTSNWNSGAATHCSTPFVLERAVGVSSSDVTTMITASAALKQDVSNSDLNIPANIHVAEGRELNIWKDALTLPKNHIHFSGAKGKSMERGFRYTGLNADIGTTTAIAITAKDQNGTLLQTKIFNLKPVAKNTGSGTKQILVIGDSLVQNGGLTQELSTLIAADGGFTPLFLGTQGSTGYKHEGRGGWSFGSFITAGSPFYISSALNFKAYMAANSNFTGSDAIDVAIIQLGVNDTLTGDKTQADIDTIITNAKALITALLHATLGYPTCKVILSIPPISGNTEDGFAENYGATSDRISYEKNMRMLWKSMIANFDNSIFSANVVLCHAGLWIDRLYGYERTDQAISARVSTTEKRHINAVHPVAEGYKQIVDGMYSTIRFVLT